MKINGWKWLCVSLLCSGGIGCESNTQNGALIGGLGGAAAGGEIGSTSHARAGKGASICAGAGVVGGPVVGDQVDKDQQAAYARSNESRSYHSSASVTREDVVNWSNRGVRDDIIIDRVERSGSA